MCMSNSSTKKTISTVCWAVGWGFTLGLSLAQLVAEMAAQANRRTVCNNDAPTCTWADGSQVSLMRTCERACVGSSVLCSCSTPANDKALPPFGRAGLRIPWARRGARQIRGLRVTEGRPSKNCAGLGWSFPITLQGL